MPPVGFERTIPASERPQTYALDRAATEKGLIIRLVKDKLGGVWKKLSGCTSALKWRV